MDVAGEVSISASGSEPLLGGEKELLVLAADVPLNAAYGALQVLWLESESLNDGGIPVLADAAVHAVAYFGDSTGNRSYSGLDASYIARVVVQLDTGFDAFDLVDPIIVADVTGNGALSGLDASFVARKVVLLPQDEIPDLPVNGGQSASQQRKASRTAAKVASPSSATTLPPEAPHDPGPEDIGSSTSQVDTVVQNLQETAVAGATRNRRANVCFAIASRIVAEPAVCQPIQSSDIAAGIPKTSCSNDYEPNGTRIAVSPAISPAITPSYIAAEVANARFPIHPGTSGLNVCSRAEARTVANSDTPLPVAAARVVAEVVGVPRPLSLAGRVDPSRNQLTYELGHELRSCWSTSCDANDERRPLAES